MKTRTKKKPRSRLPIRQRKPQLNPMRYDPSRTGTMRRAFAVMIRRAFNRFKLAVREFVAKGDAFGLKEEKPQISLNARQFAFATSPEKIKAFQAWIKAQIGVTIRGMTEQQQWKAYIEAGYKKGVGRAFDDATKRKVAAAGDNKDKLAFYQGTREQFLQSSFNQPQVVEKVQALAARTLEDLENVTDDMATRMTRTLVDGLIRGDGPLEVARELSDVVDIAKDRAEVVARTEIMRAHAEGQLDSFENQGVDLLGAMVEWSTAGDGRVCKLCQPLQGIVLTVDEARGMLPRHPQCRCAWVPANLGEDQTLQKRGKSKIDRAIAKSAKLGKDDFGPAEDVDRARPQGVMNLDYSRFNGQLDRLSADIANVFCPTGKGGGVDPSCKKVDVTSKIKSIVDVQAAAFEKKHGWTTEFTEKGFRRNWTKSLKGLEADESSIKEIQAAVDSAYAHHDIPKVPILVRKQTQDEKLLGENAHWDSSGYMVVSSDAVEEKKYRSVVKRLDSDRKTTVKEAYDNVLTGLIIHEIGHKYHDDNPTALKSAQVRLLNPSFRKLVASKISHYASTDYRELIAESFAMLKHKDFKDLPKKTQILILSVLGKKVV